MVLKMNCIVTYFCVVHILKSKFRLYGALCQRDVVIFWFIFVFLKQ